MIIRKLFKFEGAHIVRNCSSERCKKSIHGHSYTVEIFVKSQGFDNGMMVMDFGLMKDNMKDFIDGFDHAYSMWNKESDEFQTFMKNHSDRWIEMPVSPSAEAYSLMFFKVLDEMIKATEFNNGEKNVELHSVRVHETATGYAESFRDDLDWINFELKDIVLSEGIKAEFKDPQMFDKLIQASINGTKCFINPIVDQQV
ncbi:6-carboxytetrahydropterin synthase [Vibrio sp.]|uniref:6-carboxy-5,6,7,8-tetrahydropterin synthase n=1 Tax=Vibrio viridaestus TaxID=2487322 RepID=A0A3N9TKI0_9VIBR|nr:6-carboxytetrahydropterin synthase [Vibrio viridaestus]MDC0610320.1 6-carboxytetrahydropterin synthase [Vibrio sp.]RQW64353.1 6-carboxytetrahydropterin synthase [Vibrio viridaestus]